MNKADMKHKTMQFGLCIIKVEFKTAAMKLWQLLYLQLRLREVTRTS